MDYFENWNDAVVASLQEVWNKIITFIPEILGALLVLIIGLILATGLSKLAHKIVSYTKIDKVVAKIDAIKALASAGIKVSIAGMIAWLIKWFFIVVTLVAVVEILGLQQVTDFLNLVIAFLPQVAIAVIILAVGLVVGQFVYDIVEKSARTTKVTKHTAHSLAVVGKWALIIFALLASLTQLGIAATLIEIILTGLVAMLALALGLAFGLGGKEQAAKWLSKVIK
ncbi:hypothetical protein ACFL2V_15365 [Pseudomonadota bacterium]